MTGPLVYDVTVQNFVTDVVQKSADVPVLVDFWAEWCGPCKTLTPMLEKLAAAYQGRFVLAKCDTEANAELAAQFQIRSIPAVKLVIGGKLVAEFNGVQPEADIRKFIEHYCPAPAQDLFEVARQLIGEGELGDALAVLDRLLKDDPSHLAALPLKAQLLIQLKRWDDAAAFVANATFPEADSLRKQLKMFEEARTYGSLEACENAAKVPTDLEAGYRLAMVLALEGRFQESLEQLLVVLTKDKNYGEGKIRKSLLGIFELLGIHHPLSDEYRRRMGRIIL
ncbi:MAG: tetratricopeptide repeat protein [Oligoflexus sp.]|nr:tetratricopeptide repeat protein [Oligoflexus sp.]